MPTTKKPLDILCVGSATRDVIFYSDEVEIIKNPKKDPTKMELFATEMGAKLRSDNVHFEFGGGAANTAVNFRGLGLRTGIVSSIGSDHDGEAIFRMLMAKRIDTQFVQMNKKHRTGFSFILTDEQTGERTVYVYYGAVADMQLTESVVKKMNAQWLYVASISGTKRVWKQNLQLLFDRAEKSGAHVAWNPGGTQLTAGYSVLKKYIARTTVLILNKDEASELLLSCPDYDKPGSVKQMLKRIHGWGAQVVLITDGKRGSMAYDGLEYYKQDAPKDTPLSTIGAGDCFGSTFVAGIIRYKGDVPKALKLAQRNATSVVHSIGAQKGFIQWKDLPKSMRLV